MRKGNNSPSVSTSFWSMPNTARCKTQSRSAWADGSSNVKSPNGSNMISVSVCRLNIPSNIISLTGIPHTVISRTMKSAVSCSAARILERSLVGIAGQPDRLGLRRLWRNIKRLFFFFDFFCKPLRHNDPLFPRHCCQIEGKTCTICRKKQCIGQTLRRILEKTGKQKEGFGI